MIAPSSISVVVQGPVVGAPGDPYPQRFTHRALESVRKHLPGAELILSTWKGADVSGLSYDVLIESDDPGALPVYPDGHAQRVFNNVNRQITSTRAGLLAATREYAVKLRGDMILTGTGFTRFHRRYRARSDEWKILGERVVTSTIFSRNPRGSVQYPFHPSDMFHFGFREDVLNIWNIPLPPEPETTWWFDTRPRPVPDVDEGARNRYMPEQAVWLGFLRKYGEVWCDHKSDLSHDAVNVYELTLANNLVLVEPSALQVEFLKFPISRFDWLSVYSHGDWLRLYKRYCDPRAFCPPDLVAWKKAGYVSVGRPGARAGARAGATAIDALSLMLRRGPLNPLWKGLAPRSYGAVRDAFASFMASLDRAGRD